MTGAAPLAAALPDFAAPGPVTIAAELDRAAALAGAAHARAEADARAAELAAARAAGVADGRAQAGAEAAAAFTALAGSLDASASAARDAVRDSLALDLAAVVDVAAELAAWVLGRELTTDPAALLPRVEDLLADVADATAVDVAVHPDAEAAYRAWASTHPSRPVTVTADPDLAPGEATLRTGDGGHARVGAVDALRRAVDALTDAATEPADAGERGRA